jgi:hypothetical protein
MPLSRILMRSRTPTVISGLSLRAVWEGVRSIHLSGMSSEGKNVLLEMSPRACRDDKAIPIDLPVAILVALLVWVRRCNAKMLPAVKRDCEFAIWLRAVALRGCGKFKVLFCHNWPECGILKSWFFQTWSRRFQMHRQSFRQVNQRREKSTLRSWKYCCMKDANENSRWFCSRWGEIRRLNTSQC